MVSSMKPDKDALIKQLEEQVHQLENIIAVLPGNVYWLDRNGYFLGCNNETANYLHLASPKDIIGKTTREVIPEGYLELELNNKKVLENEEIVISEEAPPRSANGDVIIYLSQKAPLRNISGDIIGIIGISLDITDRKKMEKELQIAKEKAEIADQTKTEFIRNMEHDIRTPLSGVISATNYLKMKEKDEQSKELLTDIELSSHELLNYLNSILEFSHINTGEIPIQLREFNLRKIIHSIFTMELAAAKSKNLLLLLDYPSNYSDSIIGDQFRIHRALLNLVSNSIKFTDKGHVKILVRIETETNDGTILHITVEDTGIGISSEYQSTIFDKFARYYPANRNIYKGTGLGLRIVKQFMDELGGKVSLKSEPSHGSSFLLSIPINLASKS